MITFPLIVLGLLELGLRIFNYGGELDLVVKTKVGDREFYSINRSVARRYFAQAGTTIPEPADDKFEITKGKNTKRIFCLGESTMAGFPYEFHATAPGFLRDRLRTQFPQYNIEVINVGLSAVSSFVILDFIHDLVDYEPDLFVVYVGHNEFYGAYGVGSTVAIKGGAWMTRLTLGLLRIKTFLLLRDAYAGMLNWLSSGDAKKPTGSMMQQMAATQIILLHSPLYEQAREIYRENLTQMIETAQSENVPIMFSTLVSNLKDQPPLVSAFGESTSEAQKEKWQRFVTDGDSSVVRYAWPTAIQNYQAATRADTQNATGFFKLGQTYLRLTATDVAKDAFILAKDRDALRFRATEEFQNVLIATCREYNVPLARTDSAFAANSPWGIAGGELILEHLHPNVKGYFLMGKTFVHAMKKNSLLARADDWAATPSPSDSALFEQSTIAEFDETVGRLKVEFLKRRWPFNTGTTNYEFVAANPIESVAFRYVQQGIAWSDARYLLAEYYAGIKRFDLARKECLAVAKVIPFSYNPLLRVADYYRMEGKRDESKKAYERCIAVEENPYAHIKLGLTYLEEENSGKAAQELEKAMDLNTTFGEKLTVEASSAARYLLGVAYAKSGMVEKAKAELNRAIAINPNNTDARDVLRQLGDR
ncbi:MAG: tetratricopeptide repeat protein [Ignavibacteriae bacterium]|nr:tetratricopeptide repeat protein [Ignavibacteriota bacterium]